MEEHVLETIRDFIACNFLFEETSEMLPDDASLLQLGIIDSTGVLNLLMFTEEQFGLQIPDTDVTPEHFDSIQRLADYVSAKLAAKVVSV